MVCTGAAVREPVMLITQITDIHISTPGTRAHDLYDTPGHLRRWVARLNALSPRPDLVLATGDLVNEGQPDEYRILAEILAWLEIPIYLMPGNHDDRDNLRAAFPEHGYLGGTGAFINYVIEDHPLRIIALDTTIPGEVGGEVCPARLTWLSARLSEASVQPTLVAMHHPPFDTGIPAMDTVGLEGKAEFADVVRPHRQIRRIVAGHLHRTIQGTVGGHTATTAPGTAHQLGLTLEPRQRPMITREPPAAHLHLWRGHKGGLVSHTLHLEAEEIPS